MPLNKLKLDEILNLTDWLRTNRETLQGQPKKMIAEMASRALNMTVTPANLVKPCEHVGITFAVTRGTKSNLPHVVRVLRHLAVSCRRAGIELDDVVDRFTADTTPQGEEQ